MRCACGKRKASKSVFARLQGGRHDSTGSLGDAVFAGALLDSVLLQLLVGLAAGSNRPPLESSELRGAGSQSDLFVRAFSLDANCRGGHHLRADSRLSAGLLFVVPRREEKESALPTRNHSALGELPGARLCVENNPWQRRRAERGSSVYAYHRRAFSPSEFPAAEHAHPRHSRAHPLSFVQPLCRSADAYAHLHAVRIVARVRVARTRAAESY